MEGGRQVNVWIDKCVEHLKKGEFDSIKRSICVDVMEMDSLEGVKSILEEWVADLIDIKEAMDERSAD